MEPSSPPEHDAQDRRDQIDSWASLGDVAAAFVRRMNQADLTPTAMADVVAEDLSALLGGAVAVILRDQSTGERETAAVRHPDEHDEGTHGSQHRTEDDLATKDFVDIVLETGESFVAPDGGDAGVGVPPDQQVLAVPVVANDATLGVIAATRDDEEPFSGDDLELMTRVADVTALAVRGLSVPAPTVGEDPEVDAAKEAAQALEHAADAIFIIDGSGQLLSSNLASQRMLGLSDRDLVGHALHEIVADGSASRRSSDLPDFGRQAVPNFATLYEVELRRDDGSSIVAELTFSRVAGIERELYVAVGRDVSQRKRAEALLRHEASVDPLTGLVNRASVHRALGRAMHRADAGLELAVLFIDLDGFKDVNDSAGHQAGDEVLRAVAERLTECVRRDDLVARYGGDEFLVVLEAEHDIQTEVAAVCSRIREAFASPFPAGSGAHHIGASIGTAIHQRDGATISQLLSHADADMYRQKSARRASDRAPHA